MTEKQVNIGQLIDQRNERQYDCAVRRANELIGAILGNEKAIKEIQDANAKLREELKAVSAEQLQVSDLGL